jgi:colanic acid biosynthesis glycosyl transferase WcaI
VRILVVTQYFWPENFRINDLVSELVKRGHQVTVLTGKPNYPDGIFFPDFLASPEKFNEFNGAKIVRIPIPARGSGSARLVLNYLAFAFNASLLGPWLLRKQNFDVIFANQLSPVTVGIPAAVMRFFKKAPLVFWVLDLWPETIEALGITRSKFILAILRQLVRQIYKKCDLILAQSKSFIPKIAQYTESDTWIEYFPSWSDAALRDRQIEPAIEFPMSPGSFNIIFAGNIGEAQDFPAIINAAKILKEHQNIRWIIIGSGRQEAWVKEQIKKLGLEHCFILLGRFPIDRMTSFFMYADALLISLKRDPIFAMTIPGKLQSYLAAGIPILAMLDGEGGDIVRKSGSGLACASGDSVALAQCVLSLSLMPTQDRKSMGENGPIFSAKEFDRNQLISQLEQWFALALTRFDKIKS